MDPRELDRLARELFAVFTLQHNFDSLSWPMQERWRELAAHVVERPCEKCEEKDEEIEELHNELRSHIQQAVAFIGDAEEAPALEHLNTALDLLNEEVPF